MRLLLMAGFALLPLIAAPEGVVAQAEGSRSIAPSQETLGATARLRVPARQEIGLEHRRGELLVVANRSKRREGEILMIVGGAGIVLGLLTDEDLITIAGAVVGGFGLYLYLQATR